MRHRNIVALSVLIVILLFGLFALNLLKNQSFVPDETQYNIEAAFANLSFDYPAGIYNSGDETNRLFIIEQLGYIYWFENNENTTAKNLFLDIHKQVHSGALLGLAFHPNITKNGHFYIYYLADNPLRTIISQWTVKPNPLEADENSEKVLLEITQLYDSHSGGQLAFGPDGYLYIAVGDGEPYGDLKSNAQNCASLLGKILCVDVDNPAKGRPYGIPADNPFAGNSDGFREEIYAWGFRNPWRFSFDSVSGLMWAADVGQDRIEEIDIIKKGGNYGWNIMEGTLPYNASQDGNETKLEPPIWEYGREQGGAIIGGFVYRGTHLSALTGCYIYGDYMSGRIWALNYKDGFSVNKELVKTDLNITSFGVDEKNELYFCSQEGKIHLITVK